MAWYRVELTGEAREVYAVEADSPEQARERWVSGTLEISEASSMEVVSVQATDEEGDEVDPIDLQDEARGDMTPGY